ncbi:toxic anion resistance protein [Chitinophagaceae bacterium 26-R-25]|nr:toxic anion resistance protein [Chitinophagaceae bacterium 26-R-25]
MNEIVLSQEENKEPELTTEEKQKVEDYKQKIDLSNTSMVVQYGASAQNKLSSFSESVINNVRTKDSGEAGELLTNLMLKLRGFDSEVGGKKGFFSGLFYNVKKHIQQLRSSYSNVDTNIRQTSLLLEKHQQTLLKDIAFFDRLFQENVGYFREISLYIIAGDEKIKEMREVVLPKMQEAAKQSQDKQQAQACYDIEQQLIRFEKKIHDLKLTRMISLQLGPQIRFVQNNNTDLLDKIQSTITNTLPLWRTQMALALGVAHSQQALEAQKAVNDTTNELLRKNSEMLKQSTTQIATESEKGIVDMETIKKVNSDLFETLDNLVRIHNEGRQKRLAAEIDLKKAEEEMKSRMLSERDLSNRLLNS